MKERGLSKKETIKLMEEMRLVAGKLPEEVRIKRFFLADDGSGIILSDGIEETAKRFGKTVEWVNTPESWGVRFRFFQTGRIKVYQMVERGRKEG